MPAIEFDVYGFPALAPNGKKTEWFTWDDIVWAAVTYGHPSDKAVRMHGVFSEAELISRAYRLASALKGAARCKKTEVYKFADPSEVGFISYFLGMTVCKLFADRFLQVTWLIHYSHARRNGITPSLKPGSKLSPDFLGFKASGQVIVAEAKGSAGLWSDKVLSSLLKGKKQSRNVASVDGVVPNTAFSIATYFQTSTKSKGRELVACAIDPEPDPNGSRITISFWEAYRAYYYFRLAVVNSTESFHTVCWDGDGKRHEVIVRYFPEVGVAIGIVMNVRRQIVGRIREGMSSLPARQTRVKSDGFLSKDSISASENIFEGTLYPDGVLIALSGLWSEENMEKEPADREVSKQL